MPAWIAAAAALALAIFAYARSRLPAANYYAEDVYGMTPRTHRRFAAAGLLFAAILAASHRFPALAYPALGGFALTAVLYLTSFARGFSDVE